MPNVYKVVMQFAESNGATFNETYFIQTSSIQLALNFGPFFINSRLNLMHPLTIFKRIRVSQTDANRVTGTRGIALQGTASSDGAPVAPGVAVVCQLSAINGGQRKLWLRGCPSNFIERDSVTGLDIPSPALAARLNTFFNTLANNGAGMLRIQPASNNGFLLNRKILKVDGSNVNGQSVVTLESAPGYPVPSRVLIGATSKKDFPGLNGYFSVVAVNGALVTINYQTPEGGAPNTTQGHMRLAQTQPFEVFNASNCKFDHYGTRPTKSPSSNTRGARRAARLRLSL